MYKAMFGLFTMLANSDAWMPYNLKKVQGPEKEKNLEKIPASFGISSKLDENIEPSLESLSEEPLKKYYYLPFFGGTLVSIGSDISFEPSVEPLVKSQYTANHQYKTNKYYFENYISSTELLENESTENILSSGEASSEEP